MGSFAAGQVVLLPFPFSDLSQNKLRPALLLADAGRGDWVACQITSNPYADSRAVKLTDKAFATGSLRRDSYIRPGKLFTANESLFSTRVGALKPTMLDKIRIAVTAIILEKHS
jgi:mRNA interferase MazF